MANVTKGPGTVEPLMLYMNNQEFQQYVEELSRNVNRRVGSSEDRIDSDLEAIMYEVDSGFFKNREEETKEYMPALAEILCDNSNTSDKSNFPVNLQIVGTGRYRRHCQVIGTNEYRLLVTNLSRGRIFKKKGNNWQGIYNGGPIDAGEKFASLVTQPEETEQQRANFYLDEIIHYLKKATSRLLRLDSSYPSRGIC